jgi:hypothetical protein
MIGYYLALDLCHRWSDKFEWLTDKQEEFGPEFNSPLYEHFYWNGEQRTWFGAVEEAVAYPTKEEAEGQAVFAMALDADVAGHIHVVSAKEAMRREAHRIEARKLDKERRRKHEEMRYKTERGEGGPI